MSGHFTLGFGISPAEWRHAILAFVAMIVAAYLHEFTHAATARLLGGAVQHVDLWNLEVVWGLDKSEPIWKDRVINLSPQFVGGGVGFAWILLVGWPEIRLATVPGVFAWGIYTLHGGLADYSLAVSHGYDPLHRLEKHERQLAAALIVWGIGMAGLYYAPMDHSQLFWITNYIWRGLVIAAIPLLGMSVWNYRQHTSPSGTSGVQVPGEASGEPGQR